MSSPSVEVKCLETFAYYPAFLRDYDQAGQVLVSYPNAWKKDEWVLLENVRNSAPEFDAASFTPASGDIVEAQAKSSDDEPYSWWKATVKTVRGDFYMISYSSWEDEFNEILEKDMLRPFNRNPALKAADIKKLELALPKDLRDSGSLDVRALNSVLETSGALSVHIDHKKQVLVILGNTVSVKRAQLLAGMAFKHLGEIQRLTERKVKHQSHLDSLKQHLNEVHLETFSIHPPELVGLVIGVAGKNIRRVEKLPGVLNVRVDSTKSQVSIKAKSEEEAKAAREQLEFIEQRFPILKRQAGRIVGQKFANMSQIEKDSGVVRIRLGTNNPTDDPNATVDLIIIGTKETVADALLLLNHHLEFLDTVNQLSQDERELSQEVRRINHEAGGQDEQPRYGRGAGAARGARGPRPQGNRQYSGAQATDFPPLPTSARQPKQHKDAQPKQQAAAPQAQQSAQPQEAAAADEQRKDGRGRAQQRGRGRNEEQKEQQQPQQGQQGQPRQPRQPKQQQQAGAAVAPAVAAAAALPEDAAAAPATDRRNTNRGRNQRQPKTDAAAVAAPAAGEAAAAPVAAGTEAAPKQPKERRQNQRKPKTDAAASSPVAGDAAAAGSPTAAASTSPDAAAAKPKKDNQRRERRPRQPTGDAASPVAASAPASASPPAAAPVAAAAAPASVPAQ